MAGEPRDRLHYFLQRWDRGEVIAENAGDRLEYATLAALLDAYDQQCRTIERVRVYAEMEYVRALNAILASPHESTDTHRWRGQAEAYRQVAEQICRQTGVEAPAYRSDEWRLPHGVYSPEQLRRWTQSVYPVITHGPDEPMPAELDRTAEDQDRWEWRMARGFPERDYTDPAARGFPGTHDDRGSAGQPVGLDGEDAATPALAAQPPADPPFLSLRAAQFVSGFQAATRAIEADQ